MDYNDYVSLYNRLITQQNAAARSDIDAAIAEIIRLQERVDALEKAQETPDKTFYAQLLFDAFVIIGIIYLILCGVI